MRGHSARGLERQRQRIRDALLASPNRSDRSIAAEIGCSHCTVARIRGLLADADHLPEGGQADRPPHPGAQVAPPPLGNARARTHGARSEDVLAPRREQHFVTLREYFPGEPEPMLRIAANRAARAEVLADWLDDRGLMHGRGGDLRAAAAELTRIETALERQYAGFVERAKGRPSPNGLTAVLAEIIGETP
jgi:hypothetical protein